MDVGGGGSGSRSAGGRNGSETGRSSDAGFNSGTNHPVSDNDDEDDDDGDADYVHVTSHLAADN